MILGAAGVMITPPRPASAPPAGTVNRTHATSSDRNQIPINFEEPVILQPAAAAGTTPTPAFTNTPLISTLQLPGITTAPNANSTGNSEPAIAFGKDGSMAVDGLGWLPFQSNLWKGHFGATPSYFGAMDTN